MKNSIVVSTFDEIKRVVISEAANHFGYHEKDIRLDVSVYTFGDSLDVIEFFMNIEGVFGVSISVDVEEDRATTLLKIIKCVANEKHIDIPQGTNRVASEKKEVPNLASSATAPDVATAKQSSEPKVSDKKKTPLRDASGHFISAKTRIANANGKQNKR